MSVDREALWSVLQIYGIVKLKLGAYADAARGLGAHLRDIALEPVAGRSPLPRDTGPE